LKAYFIQLFSKIQRNYICNRIGYTDFGNQLLLKLNKGFVQRTEGGSTSARLYTQWILFTHVHCVVDFHILCYNKLILLLQLLSESNLTFYWSKFLQVNLYFHSSSYQEALLLFLLNGKLKVVQSPLNGGCPIDERVPHHVGYDWHPCWIFAVQSSSKTHIHVFYASGVWRIYNWVQYEYKYGFIIDISANNYG